MTILIRRLAHYAAYAMAGIVILLSLAALALRFLVVPEIASYRADIEASASKAVGQPVHIQSLQADWAHFNPHITLENVSIAPAGQPAALHIERIEATVSWLSLLVMEPRLASLDIYRPVLDIRRAKDGTIFVAGIPVNRGGPSNPFPDWLLRQRTVTLSDGQATWIDDQMGAPPLTLEHLDFGLDNLFSRHRFGLTALPPSHAVARLDIRGDVHGDSLDDFKSWRGQIYLRADQASAAALNTWSPWAQSAVRRSVGDVRFWLDFAQGRIGSVTGDAALRDVAVSLSENLPDMAFRQISGRLAWSQKGNLQTYAVQSLRFVTAAGQTAEPADFKVSFTPTASGKVETLRVEADSLRLEALTALSGAIPLPRQTHDWLAAINPHGFIEHLDFSWLGRDRFHLITRFREAGMNSTGALPGFSGLDGDIEADDHKGQVTLGSDNFRLVYNSVFRQPIDLSHLAAQAAWSGTPGEGYRINLEKCELGNPDLDGTAQGTLALAPDKSPVIDLQARLTRGRGDAVWRYLPRSVDDDAYDWLKRSIVGGTSPDTRLILRGPLDRFPFDQGGGQFQVKVRIRDGVLAYAPDWPRITGIDGWLTFEDKRMTITAERGDILGVRLAPVEGHIADLMHTHDQMLELKGLAQGPTANFLEFIRQSPVDDYMEHFTETMKATGNGTLSLGLHMPLSDVANTRVTGRYTLAGNDVTLDERLPTLTQVSGSVDFTDTSVSATGISARLFDRPITIGLGSEHGGRIHARVAGNLDAKLLAGWLPDALGKRLAGTTPFQADISAKQHAADIRLESRLNGLAIDLPEPIGKQADGAVPLTVEVVDRGNGTPPVTFRYGDAVAGNFLLGGSHGQLSIMLGGPAAPAPDGEGITVSGTLRQLDLDAWRRIDLGPAGSDGMPVRSINLTLNELRVFNRQFNDINLQAQPATGGWHFKFNGREAIGEASYTTPSGTAGKSLTGQFEKLVIPQLLPDAGAGGQFTTRDLPGRIDLAAKSFTYGQQDLGRLTLKLAVANDGIDVQTLKLEAPEASLSSHGWLAIQPPRPTRLDVNLTSGDLGSLMRRLGYANAVKGGALKVSGNLDWSGRPESLSLAQLNGKLKLQLDNGRFLQLDPGAAKLLGILSLQALPRRITLDFRDIFSEGFAFDSIDGDIILDRGVGYLPGLAIKGPAATIDMKGQIDLVKESQALRLHIQPRLDEGVAVGAALLGGPVVGVGTLVAAKVLKNPISQAASFEYQVDGTWDDPVVTKLARPVAGSPDSKP